ncbi:MAG: MoaD/ThiS family protein [Anaerolineae bacterium]|jgi:molybdopterin converting factor small subunit|nr:MoaD/ThiS family protein [Anaerolineae bacterium]
MIDVLVEFAGVTRVLTKTQQLTLSVPEHTTFRTVVHMLGERFPELVGHVIDPADNTLYASTSLSLNGKSIIAAERWDESPEAGDRLIFLSLMAGG